MTDNTEARILATDVIARNDGLHGDPARSPYQWGAALKLARAYLALTAPLDEKYAEIQKAVSDPAYWAPPTWWQKHCATLLDAIRVVTAELQEAKSIRWTPTGDNHHNAWLCPHCNVGNESPASLTRRCETAEAELAKLREQRK